jgi:hypothetical protein
MPLLNLKSVERNYLPMMDNASASLETGQA